MRRERARPSPSRRLALGLGALLLGCGRAAPPAKLPEPGQVPRATVFAGPPPGVTVTQAPPEPEQEPEATVTYASLRLACDSVEALAKRRNFQVTRGDGVAVDFGFGGPPRTGCELKASGKFTRAAPDSAAPAAQAEDEPSTLADGFKEAGWAYLAQYQADGPDGEAEGWRSKETTCVVRWSWDGGDDSDSTYVPTDDWDLVIGCAATA